MLTLLLAVDLFTTAVDGSAISRPVTGDNHIKAAVMNFLIPILILYHL